jgi:uncharacterized Zn finger protein
MKAIRTWWGRRFIAALETFTDSGRLTRGRGYANNDRVKAWTIEGPTISATIRGNINPYYGVYKEPLYRTRIALHPISEPQWVKIIAELGGQAAYVSRLLMNEMPESIEKPFEKQGLHLLPRNAKDIRTDCSCPDWQNPCKHVAGLYYLLAAKLDQDPFLLLELRGLPRETLLARLRETPLGLALADALSEAEAPLATADSFFARPLLAPLPSKLTADDFWRPRRRLPEVIEPAVPPAISALLVKKGGDNPAFWTRDNSFVEAMEGVYEAVRKRMKSW